MFNSTTKTLSLRLKKLEEEVEALQRAEQLRKCKAGRHLQGEIVDDYSANPWIRCPACYANLSNPKGENS